MNIQELNPQKILKEALVQADDGDLYIENRRSQHISIEDSTIRHCSFSESGGFGLRRVVGEESTLIHKSLLTYDSIHQAAKDIQKLSSSGGTYTEGAKGHVQSIFKPFTATEQNDLAYYTKLLKQIDAYAREKEPALTQVAASISLLDQDVYICRLHEDVIHDVRPKFRLNIQVVLEGQHTGYVGKGGRYSFSFEDMWQTMADEAIRQAHVKKVAKPAPSGEMPIIMSAGWSGVLFHEAVGHGLEADFNRKGTSAFTGKIGQRVAAKGVTIVDDGTLNNGIGSLNIDDEGTTSKRNVLIEDGILKQYMSDRLNARLLGTEPSGNGRRESYASMPIPRMTNTFLDNGEINPDDIIADTKRGFYAKTLGGGQVDITSGNFVFEVSEGYLIENGKLTTPLKGATLIGNGPEILPNIDAIGNNLDFDPGIGMCGKDGQSVPAGLGQPTCRVAKGINVGGTA